MPASMWPALPACCRSPWFSHRFAPAAGHQVIVPLVYRPAIKSAMLAAPFTSTLAQMLGAPGAGRTQLLRSAAQEEALQFMCNTRATYKSPNVVSQPLPLPAPPLLQV